MPLIRQILLNPAGAIVPALLFAGTIVAGLILRRVLFSVLRKWSARTDSHLGVLFTETLRGPIVLWSIILGVHIATQNSEIPARYLHQIAKWLEALWVLALTIAISRFAGNSVRFYGGRVTGAQSVTSLTQKLVQVVVVTIGLAWLLKVVFDVSLTPIVTTLGVGGLAVALALQDTLSNLFAGFYVSVSGLVRIGDYIRLNTGEEGYVNDINWRCTTLRGLSNNTIVIPNNKLGQANYTNYNLPDKRMSLSLSINVAPDADLERIEAMLLEEALAAAKTVPGILPEPEPNIRFVLGTGDWPVAMQVNFQIAEFADQFLAQSELRRRIFGRLRKEGVTLPTPQAKSARIESTSPA